MGEGATIREWSRPAGASRSATSSHFIPFFFYPLFVYLASMLLWKDKTLGLPPFVFDVALRSLVFGGGLKVECLSGVSRALS